MSKELWAIVNKNDGHIRWSRGGSSTSSKLMVYDNERSAKRALNNSWTKQVINSGDVCVLKIYDCEENNE